MFKKDGNESATGSIGGAGSRGGSPSRVGASTTLEGEVRGAEDLIVEGRIKGLIELVEYDVTVAASGHVEGDIKARTVVIEGQVDGNVRATDGLAIRRTGRVAGELQAPRVALDDGARFEGAVDMSPVEAKTAQKAPQKKAKEKVDAVAAPSANAGRPGASPATA